MKRSYTITKGNSAIVATAIHDGHQIRPELGRLFNLTDSERLREEDPFTSRWLNFTDNRVTVHHSRFETDVNRPPDKAVYRKPEDAWGLHVWKDELPEEAFKVSMGVYKQFYMDMKAYFDQLFSEHPILIVYDIHTYNYRRESKEKEADPIENPEINIGTKNMDRKQWRPVVKAMINSFRSFNYKGRFLNVGENIKFKGGYFGQWLYETYGSKICPVSIEFKKFFMDEWTGKPYEQDIKNIRQLLQQSVNPVMQALEKIKQKQLTGYVR